MPSRDENLEYWDRAYEWEDGGEVWSVPWGSSYAMWYGTVMSRIGSLLPTGHLLEIAPGFGRCTRFLLPLCRRYTGVDLAERCIRACEERFAGASWARFHAIDGRTFPEVQADSVDLAFSWDSLVHVEAEVMASLISELGRTLNPGGIAFLHHSHFGDLEDRERLANPNTRDPTHGASHVRGFAADAGLECVQQEIVCWGEGPPMDCYSLLRRPPAGEEARAETAIFENTWHPQEMAFLKELDRRYRRPEFGSERGEDEEA